VRVVAIDLGTARIGVAVSDPSGVLASPYEVVPRNEQSHARLQAIVEEVGAERVVVGLPLSLDGRKGPAAQLIEAEVVELRELFTVPVELYDERFTTVTAHQHLAASGKRSKARRGTVDGAAAAVLLQSWLDGRGPA
jgi:putative Holliday junction resolvase